MSSSKPAGRIWRGADAPHATTARLAVDLPGAARGQALSVADRVEAAREEGYQQGRADALAEMSASAEGERRQRLAGLADAVGAAAAAVVAGRQGAVTVAEVEVVTLALELAEVLIGRELSLDRPAVADALHRALRLVPDGEDLVVRLHPDDLAAVPELPSLVPDRQVRLVPDDTVEPGGCVVDAGPCHVDAQMGPALARARELLAGLRPGGDGASEPPAAAAGEESRTQVPDDADRGVPGGPAPEVAA